ncbi:hypothetical protein [Sphaerospermopsis aphanizomenoides]|uniref:hypothetical protein n=1 Tax=Sphaerospermopsis aphanizomenoides TaxID=459663 RepID=UPI00188034E1|nr:hypothetical protein [Sphaerospermopsis aphanizomenoides]
MPLPAAGINKYTTFLDFVNSRRQESGVQESGVQEFRRKKVNISPQSPVTNHQSPVTHYQLPITHYQLPITHYQLPFPISHKIRTISFNKYIIYASSSFCTWFNWRPSSFFPHIG